MKRRCILGGNPPYRNFAHRNALTSFTKSDAIFAWDNVENDQANVRMRSCTFPWKKKTCARGDCAQQEDDDDPPH